MSSSFPTLHIAYFSTREVVKETWSAEDSLIPLLSITGAGLLFVLFWALAVKRAYL